MQYVQLKYTYIKDFVSYCCICHSILLKFQNFSKLCIHGDVSQDWISQEISQTSNRAYEKEHAADISQVGFNDEMPSNKDWYAKEHFMRYSLHRRMRFAIQNFVFNWEIHFKYKLFEWYWKRNFLIWWWMRFGNLYMAMKIVKRIARIYFRFSEVENENNFIIWKTRIMMIEDRFFIRTSMSYFPNSNQVTFTSLTQFCFPFSCFHVKNDSKDRLRVNFHRRI